MTFSALVLTLSMNLSALAYDAPQIPGNEGQVQASVAREAGLGASRLRSPVPGPPEAVIRSVGKLKKAPGFPAAPFLFLKA